MERTSDPMMYSVGAARMQERIAEAKHGATSIASFLARWFKRRASKG